MTNINILNKRDELAKRLTSYVISDKQRLELSPIDIFNQFIYDENLMITDDSVSDWLLNFIHDVKKMDKGFLEEIYSTYRG